MAYLTATHWGLNFWESRLDSFNSGMDVLYDQLWESSEALYYADITRETNSQVTGKTWTGGTVNVYGRNLMSYDYDAVSITRFTYEEPGLYFDAAGSLKPGGYWGILGTLTRMEMRWDGGSVIGTGQYEYGYFGDLTARNATETYRQDNGQVLTSKTDSSGNFISHHVQVGGHELSVQGRWGYNEVIDSWQDLLDGEDTLQGSSGNDYLQGYAGSDTLLGGEGTDTALFQGQQADYRIEQLGEGRFTVTDTRTYRDGQDSLESVERLAFSDGALAWDTGSDGVAGQAYRLYQAAFDRTPDEPGLGYWIAQMDQGMDLLEVSARFIDSSEFRSLYGVEPTNAEYLHRLYTNILDREPDPSGYEWWLDQLNNNPEKTWERVLADFSESEENQQNMLELTGGVVSYDLFELG